MLTTPFRNQRDDDTYPVCPACDRSIRPGESVARVADYMVHIECTTEARERVAAEGG
jgi:hypothetical protein